MVAVGAGSMRGEAVVGSGSCAGVGVMRGNVAIIAKRW